jgi:uncharacterized protein YjbI with pentapeptide repeats
MKIVKPLTLGLLHQPYRYRGEHRLAIAALGFFALGRDDERFLVENLQWPKALAQLPHGQPLDHVLPKARAEAMLAGIAHAPRPVQAMDVRLRCGLIDKRIRVYGDRPWRRRWWGGICVDPAAPFARMPLTLDRAYGGAGHDNPQGRGFLPRLAWLRRRGGAMPNLEYPGQPALPGRSARAHAALLPMPLALAARQRRASGTYDRRWLAEDFPGLPRDFDFSLYNLSPIDQQFVGTFVGGEPYALEGVHPSGEALTGTLPSMRLRAFVLEQGQDAGQAREVELRCDTVWFFPEAGLGLMIHRGQTPVADSDALDVAALMLGYDAAERPRTVAHFREVLALRLAPETAALHAFDESQLAPVRSARAQAERAAAQAREQATAQAKRQAVLDETMAEFWQRSGLEKPKDYVPPIAPAPLLPTISAHALEESDFDLAEIQAQARALADRASADRDRRLDELAARLSGSVAPAKDEDALRDEALQRARVPAHDLQPQPVAGAVPLPPDLAQAFALAERAAPGTVDPAQLAEARAALARVPELQRKARAAAPTPVPASVRDAPLPPSVARALGEEVLALHAVGACLAGRDLAGADLRGADLRGADLRQTQLERADLRGADLRGACLAGAALTAAHLDGADLAEADLADANLCATTAHDARFAGARLDRIRADDAQWRGADLSGVRMDAALMPRIHLEDARLDDSVLERCVLLNAHAAGSRWVGTRWRMCVAPGADFRRARFDAAQLQRSVLMDADLSDGSWQGATLHTVYAGGKSDWRRARLGLLRATKCGWRDSALTDADLQGATLASCDFGGADLSGACLRGAQLYRSLFMRSALRGVDARGASFFQALCRKADFGDADLREAVLVQADLAEARMIGARLAGARVDRVAGAA